ncbi:hypothetical protein D9M72_456590 [compost metagenome]
MRFANVRRTRSASNVATCSMAAASSARTVVWRCVRTSSSTAGSKRAANRALRERVTSGLASSVSAMNPNEFVLPIWRMYFA